MASLPPVINLQAFEAVARRRSFVLAAAELHLTASAISHQVSRLEAHLGVRLFERSAHGVRISAAGELYLSRVGGALSAIAAATEDLRQGVSNSLYVHSAPSIASLWLMARLHGFAKAYPDISLNLSAAHTPSDFELGSKMPAVAVTEQVLTTTMSAESGDAAVAPAARNSSSKPSESA